MKTFIRQPGNKSKYIKFILPHLPNEYNMYYEPFIGTGAIFLHLQPKVWVINDVNDDLMNLYRVVRNDSSNLIKSLKTFGTRTDFINISNKDRLSLLRKCLQVFITLPFETKRAMYYIILKYSAFNGIISSKSKFYFRGLDLNLTKRHKPSFLLETFFKKIKDAAILLNTKGKIYNCDYKRVLKKTRKNDFCFIDPPYVEDHDYQFTYNLDGKNKNELFIDELYEELQKLDKKQVKWLMTQADTVQIRNRFKEYNITNFSVFRGFSNSYKSELIIKNY